MEEQKTIELKIPIQLFTEINAFSSFVKSDKILREALAIGLYVEKVISLGRAAELAGYNLVDFMKLLNNKGIPVINYTEEDYEMDLQAIEKYKELIRINKKQ